MSAHEVAAAIMSSALTYTDEDSLQRALSTCLTEAGIDNEREVRLGDLGRIDLMAGRTGIEVKVKGSLTGVTKQMMRYAHSADIEDLVLVTTRASHVRIPRDLGKPVAVVCLIEGGLL